MRISDWSSDVCSSDLQVGAVRALQDLATAGALEGLGTVGVGHASDLVVETGQPDRRVELVGHPLLDHLELHRSDCCEHGALVATQVGAEHLDDAFLVQLLDAAAELLVAAEVDRKSTRLNSSH